MSATAAANNKASSTAGDVQQQPRKPQSKKNTNVHINSSKNRRNNNPSNSNNNGKNNRYNKHHNNNHNNKNGGRHHHHGRHHHRNSGKHSTDNYNANDNNIKKLSRKQVPHSELTTSLLEVSTSRNLIESTEGIQNRRRVMKRLDDMLCAWSDSLLPPLSYAEKLSLSTTSSSSSLSNRHQQQPSLLSFGSYRLGVHNPNADIDCLVLAPPHVQRTDFFDSWITVLKNQQQQQQSSSSSNDSKSSSSVITDIHPVSTAYTPVVKFCMDGIKIDMIFARLTNAQLNWLNECRLVRLQQQQQQQQQQRDDDNNEQQHQQLPILQEVTEMQVSDDILFGLDETSARSVNGVRVSQYLLSCVGDGSGSSSSGGERLDNFRLTLRIVKEWARVHGLYSNVLGFLGGVNWAILVCWVCKENPNAKPSMLLNAFFRTFANWSWPHPVLLSKQQTRPMKGVMSHPIWDPVNNFRDSKHLMPIITPCYPSMNSSYNVGEPQLRRIQDELRRATKISNDVCFGRKTWSDLFKGNDFFRQHANYLQVDISSSNEDEFREWFGLCEARMRILIAGLENPSYGTQAYPFAKFFTRKEDDVDEKEDGGEGKYVSSFFIAIRFAEYAQKIDLGPLVMDYLQIVNSWEKRTATMDLKMNLVLQENLPSFAFEVECAEKENEANDTDSTATETPTKSIGEQEEEEEVAGTLNAEATDSIHDKEVASRGAKKTIEQATPAPTKKKLDDSATPSIFISPLKRAKIG